ncbi:holin family protein [Frigidibacter sp. ROC022]|uniref:holin family protein n=1 Tax=Frigidibacter sp. ROC022 TaxID=2971796 RepID=UPI00215A3DD5|nr:holin family protein [Frigidibacter sp. ROC022]MCR8725461.1 holin family protein [Frigidibacter sp. ROC022]
MGLIRDLFALLFGSGRNLVAETAEVFRPNAEAQAGRDAAQAQAALAQFGAEFLAPPRPGRFDRMMDALNRLPRPMLALGTVGLFVSAMTNPVWFASRMQGIALVPEPLWWLMGAIVSFYFGARHQAKGQEFQRSIAETLSRTREVGANLAALSALQAGFGLPPGSLGDPEADPAAAAAERAVRAGGTNAALDDWRQGLAGGVDAR